MSEVKAPLSLGNLPDLAVESLDSVGCIDQLTDSRRFTIHVDSIIIIYI